MPATAISICNAALIKLGGKTIEAFDDDLKEAELCAERYPRLRDSLLRSHTWTFAKKIVTLDEPVASDVDSWTYSYTLPPDLARPLGYFSADDIPLDSYELSGNTLYSDENVVIVRYIVKYDDADDNVEFPDDFAEALANLLAADICVSLMQNISMRETYYGQYQAALATARFNGAIELPPQTIQAGTWLSHHQGYPTSQDPSARDCAS
jgi:hypothetical protein